MKLLTLKIILPLILSILALTFACKKKPETPPANNAYSSLNEFLTANAVASEFFNIDATAGGSFISAKGTKVTIKPNSFIDNSYNPITGTVKIEFKDIYAKSDMLFSQMPAMLENGAPLKSAGEFFMNVTQNNLAIMIAENKPISIMQKTIGTGGVDTAMKPFIFGKAGWVVQQKDTGPILPVVDSLKIINDSSVFLLYSFSGLATKGTWCNSDNSQFFRTYTQTELSIIPDFTPADYDMNVFLIFKNVNSMVHIYDDGTGQFPYLFAPIGLSCTIVVVGTKGNVLYSSFTDITISANQTVHIPISATTADDFKTKLKTLD